MEVQELDGVLANWWRGMGAQAAIVRPDHYVYAVADNAPSLALELADLARQLGPLPEPLPGAPSVTLQPARNFA